MNTTSRNYLPIGQFALLCNLAPRTLRFYDDMGVLRPERVDSHTGYRLYAVTQLHHAQLLARLRSLDLPLEDLKTAVSAPERVPEVLRAHRERLARRVVDEQVRLEGVEAWLQGRGGQYTFALRELPEERVASIRGWATLGMFDTVCPADFQAIRAHLAQAGVTPLRYSAFLCHGTPDHAGWCDYEVTVPIPPDADVEAAGRVRISTLPAGTAAYTVHSGDYQQLPSAYTALAEWIETHGFTFAGPSREIYVVTPGEGVGMAEWRTEVLWPVATARE